MTLARLPPSLVAWVAAVTVLGLPAGGSAHAAQGRPTFVDITEDAGITWGIDDIALLGWNLVETMGGGGGFVDYDRDGDLDIYLVSYSTHPQANGRVVGDALYRNNGDGTFTDVTQQAGISGSHRGMGLTVGDYDNDGWPDLYVTAYGESVLYHNEGNGTFSDVTGQAGVGNNLWGIGATFLDYDRDGRLDLFVPNYLDFDPDGRFPCDMIEDRPFCTIGKFRGQPSRLFHNRGDGTFEDVSAAAGIAGQLGKGMGVVAADFDDDGWIDIFQTNDASPCFLFHNQRDGTFREVGLEAEVAYDLNGRALGAMSVDVNDQNGDGLLDLVVTFFSNQGTFFYRNLGGMRFKQIGNDVGLGNACLKMSGFGVKFLDFDNDGLQDLFVANGHPFAPVAKVWPGYTYAEPPYLFRNTGDSYRDVAAESGEAMRRSYVGRGLATGDIDNDGDPDVLLLCVTQPPRLLRNDGGNRNGWLGVGLQGTRSNRDGIGTKVTIRSGGRMRSQVVRGGTSYLSASDTRLLFGLGDAKRVERIEVDWPSGHRDVLTDVAANRYIQIIESHDGRGESP